MYMAMTKDQLRVPAPPIPREHGAWFMLYMPLIAVLIGTQANWAQSVVLICTVTAGFFAQHVAVSILRGRAGATDRLWLTVYCSVLGAGSLFLLLSGYVALMWLGFPIGLFMVWHLLRSRYNRKRVDRTYLGEMLAIWGLTVTAPVAYVIATGQLDWIAFEVWALFFVFFYSSVFYVKMFIEAVKTKSDVTWKTRFVVGKWILLYHAILGLGLLLLFQEMPEIGMFLVIAFAPIFLRTIWGWATLSNVMPKLLVVGLMESGYTLWFSAWAVVVLRMVIA